MFTDGYRYNGAKGDIKVYNPAVELDDEYSTSQVCLINGAYYDFESVESGWAVCILKLINPFSFILKLLTSVTFYVHGITF